MFLKHINVSSCFDLFCFVCFASFVFVNACVFVALFLFF